MPASERCWSMKFTRTSRTRTSELTASMASAALLPYFRSHRSRPAAIGSVPEDRTSMFLAIELQSSLALDFFRGHCLAFVDCADDRRRAVGARVSCRRQADRDTEALSRWPTR